MANFIQRNLARFVFGYDAIAAKNRRKAPTSRALSEDKELRQEQRRIMSTGMRDLIRNMSVARWAVNKHLDYVSTFDFQARTGNQDLDDEIESLMKWWSRPSNFDAAGRHSRQRFMRIVEARRTIDGDVLVNKLADGTVQGIEGDRVGTPGGGIPPEQKIDQATIVNGVVINGFGRAQSYIVCRREGTGLVFDRVLPAAFADLHGYFDRFDQVRGVSPLASAYNILQDVYEGIDYALAKAKVAQLFALAFVRNASDQLGLQEAETTDDGTTETGRYNIDFGNGPAIIDLDAGDDAKFLESATPSTEFQAFANLTLSIALKALDIPFSFFNESFTNYSGARQALLQYEQSAACKRLDNIDLLNRLTAWRLGLFIRDGDLVLPKGVAFRDLQWEWIPAGIPWIDPLKEVKADLASIGGGLASPQMICKERNRDFYEVIDQTADAIRYAKEKGVPLNFNNDSITEAQAAQQQEQST